MFFFLSRIVLFTFWTILLLPEQERGQYVRLLLAESQAQQSIANPSCAIEEIWAEDPPGQYRTEEEPFSLLCPGKQLSGSAYCPIGKFRTI